MHILNNLFKEINFLKSLKVKFNSDFKPLLSKDSTAISFNLCNSFWILCKSLMMRNSVPSFYQLDHPHPPFLAHRSIPMSLNVVDLVPNLRSLDFVVSTFIVFLSCLSY